jgi:hypothetical protein
MVHRLQLHPQSHCPSVEWVVAEIELPEGGPFRVHYKLAGAIGDIAIPDYAGPQRADELWRTTCFELFVRPETGPGYLEFNFSPSGRWAAYAFAGHREAMTEVELPAAPHIRFVSSGQGLALVAEVQGIPEAEPLAVGLSAVIEETDGTKSYWALAHPPGKPDFHHPDCFALELPAPSAP